MPTTVLALCGLIVELSSGLHHDIYTRVKLRSDDSREKWNMSAITFICIDIRILFYLKKCW